MNYNCQPYAPNGDTTGARTIGWFAKNVFPNIIPALRGQTCLEVGCGNGRLFQLYANHFDRVYAIDPVCTIDGRFWEKNIWYAQRSLSDFVAQPFLVHTVLFLGSYQIICEQYGFQDAAVMSSMAIMEGGSVIAFVGRRNPAPYVEGWAGLGFDLNTIPVDGDNSFILVANNG